MMVPVTFGSLTTPQRIALGVLALLIKAYPTRRPTTALPSTARTIALGYVRRSKESGARTISLEDQRARIGAYCRERRWSLAEVLADDGVSSRAKRSRWYTTMARAPVVLTRSARRSRRSRRSL